MSSVVAPASPVAASAHDAWLDEVRALLDRRAAAVVGGDEAAFMRTVDRDAPSFRIRERRWFRALGVLPLASYELRLADDGYQNLAAALRRRADAETYVVEVSEHMRIRGYDEEPTDDLLFLTVRRSGGSLVVAGDDDLDDLGLRSARHPWHFGAVGTRSGGGVLVLHDGSPSRAERILADTRAAVARIRAAWPLRWDDPVIVVVPSSVRALGRMLQATFDLGPFVAFAGSSLRRSEGGWRYVAPRVYVQPGTFFRSSRASQAETLGHEMLHVASRRDAGRWHPAWLEEGVAQIFGERSAPGFAELARRARAGRIAGLPPDEVFFVGSRSDIRNAYESSAHFVRYLVRRFDRGSVARFYETLGDETPVSVGTARYHLDRASRSAFGVTLRALERAWVTRVGEEFR